MPLRDLIDDFPRTRRDESEAREVDMEGLNVVYGIIEVNWLKFTAVFPRHLFKRVDIANLELKIRCKTWTTSLFSITSLLMLCPTSVESG